MWARLCVPLLFNSMSFARLGIKSAPSSCGFEDSAPTRSWAGQKELHGAPHACHTLYHPKTPQPEPPNRPHTLYAPNNSRRSSSTARSCASRLTLMRRWRTARRCRQPSSLASRTSRWAGAGLCAQQLAGGRVLACVLWAGVCVLACVLNSWQVACCSLALLQPRRSRPAPCGRCLLATSADVPPTSALLTLFPCSLAGHGPAAAGCDATQPGHRR